jgi:hypothetical protein
MLLALFALFAIASAQTAADCTQFCNDYNTTCMMLSTGNDVYSTMQACQDECMKYPVDANCPDGSDATMCASGNSFGCRRYHLNVAMSNASDPSLAMTHCPHTTPLSSPSASITATDALTGTVCKTMVNGTTQNGLIADFCNQVTGTCGNYLQGITMDTCVHFYSHVGGATDVSNYPDGSNRKFPVAATTGSGLPCRRYHIQVARSAGNAPEHCPHALMGAGGCGTTCETYCAMGMAICPSMFDANCEADCAAKVPVAVDYAVTTNKDIVCRIYHLSVASTSAANAVTHCPHTTIQSTADTCGSSASTVSFSALLIVALAMITKFSA